MAKLRVAEGLALPADAITQTFGILAKRGAGKTNTAVVMAEEMHRAGLPFVVIDPVDAWWGLRSSTDGKGPGLPVPVFGGKHGDVPLERTGGQLLADLVVDERLSCVLSLFEFSEGDKIRFLIDFAERLYRRNEDPLHLFLEEADDYAPQRPFREQARLVRAWENVVRRGRQRGLGITMITQRSAALNKNVLTQIETLVVLRTTSPQDRKAIQGWVEYHGQSLELLESLPGLEDGEAWVWSPHWLKIVKRVRFRLRETFDSAATPKEIRGKRPPATLADVDLGAIRKRMAATIERAKAEDPRELRRRVATLEAELARIRQAGQAAAKHARADLTTDQRRQWVERERELLDLVRERDAALRGIRREAERMAGAITAAQVGLERATRSLDGEAFYEPPKLSPASPPRLGQIALGTARAAPGGPGPPSGPPSPPGRRWPAPEGPPTPAQGDLHPSHLRILRSLATFEALGRQAASKRAIAAAEGYAPGGGRYGNLLGRLSTAGCIAYPSPGMVALTPEGRALAARFGVAAEAWPLHTHEAILDVWRGKLTASYVKVLERVAKAYPGGLGKADLAQETGYNLGGGRFGNILGRLSTLGLVTYPTPGQVRAADELFPDA